MKIRKIIAKPRTLILLVPGGSPAEQKTAVQDRWPSFRHPQDKGADPWSQKPVAPHGTFQGWAGGDAEFIITPAESLIGAAFEEGSKVSTEGGQVLAWREVNADG
jgi:hypothetical protein